MLSVSVSCSREYCVQIGHGLLNRVGQEIRSLSSAETAVIVSGEQVFPLYGKRLSVSLEREGFRVLSFIHPSGEAQKNLETYGKLLAFLSENQVTRSDLLISLGGGVTGDLTGFAAATYLRGLDYVQIPTSLLAMVDSSVGGKTAVNLPTGKNQAGCFYQPVLVLCDPEFLKTLPERELRSGWAEVIKYGVLGSAGLLDLLRHQTISDKIEEIIASCVEIKKQYVTADEEDTGCRRFLNLGHSIGHAIELCSHYTVAHGEAVAVGMAMIARASAAKGICSRETSVKIEELLQVYGLPVETVFSREDLLQAMLHDKKRRGSEIVLVLPETLGQCRLETVSLEELSDWLRLGGAM